MYEDEIKSKGFQTQKGIDLKKAVCYVLCNYKENIEAHYCLTSFWPCNFIFFENLRKTNGWR